MADGVGFIKTQSSDDVFFHKSEYTGFSDQSIAEHVVFAIANTLKGKAVKNVVGQKISTIERLATRFVFTRAAQLKNGKVINRTPLQTAWFSDTQSASINRDGRFNGSM